jgi:hypothetical protein
MVHISSWFVMMMVIYWADAYTVYYKEKHKRFIFDSKEIGLEVIAYETKYMVVSRDQNAGRNHTIKIDNRKGGTFQILGNKLKE